MASKSAPATGVLRTGRLEVEPLPEARFGGRIRFDPGHAVDDIAALEASPEALPGALIDSGGLLVLSGMDAITDDPSLLVRLSYLLGPEVENYHHTLSQAHLVHESVDEILVLSNLPPSGRQPPPRPTPPYTEDAKLPLQFPHRVGWHTDQSFRRPPPDISLFYAVTPCPKGQGQTLYANATLAYEGLSPALRKRVESLQGLHVYPWAGRSFGDVKAGVEPAVLQPHQHPQPQPVVRFHPVTGKPALYLCEHGQMDWLEGPLVGMQPGPDGDGKTLLYQLMTHLTEPRFVYAHDWDEGDLVIHDNRNMLHSATWFDTDKHTRRMWRTTVMGNPGPLYAGERRSWIPQAGVKPMEGLVD